MIYLVVGPKEARKKIEANNIIIIPRQIAVCKKKRSSFFIRSLTGRRKKNK